MTSRLPNFNAHYAICVMFNQSRKCLVHVLASDPVRPDYDEHSIYWVERPEDEYGINLSIHSRDSLCVLYREDWLRGEVIGGDRHQIKQFNVGDRVKVLKQICDVVPVGAVITIKEVRDENPGNCDPKTPGTFPPKYVYLFDYQGRECGHQYDKLELVEEAPEAPPKPKKLFAASDEFEFKRQFAIQWLAAIEAVNYQDNCYRGWKGHKPPVEDAKHLADRAWEEWKETIGVSE
jgi:hypothetical protein